MIHSLPPFDGGTSMWQLALMLTFACVAGVLALAWRKYDDKARRRAASPAREGARQVRAGVADASPGSAAQANARAGELLLEAAVFASNGRRQEAQRVLDGAMRQGHLGPEEVVGFWLTRRAG